MQEAFEEEGMQQPIDAIVASSRSCVRQASETCADIDRYLQVLPPLKLRNVILSGPIREAQCMYEVVMPGYRGVDMSRAGPHAPKLLGLIHSVRRKSAAKRKSFGRGQVRVV